MKTSLKFLTFNIRHDHGPDSPYQPFAAPPQNPTFKHEQAWAIRKWKVADTVLLYEPDIIGFQEPVHHQVIDLEALLDDYDWIGVGRDDGEQKGEYSAVFYKRDKVTVENWKTIWLSETPEVAGSKGWDANNVRAATQVLFKRKEDGQTFTVLNAHLDHRGLEARRGAASLLLEQVKHQEGLVILMGDLNSPEDDPAYQILTSEHYNGRKDENNTLRHLEPLNDKAASLYAQKTGQPIRTGENKITLPTHRVFRRPVLEHQQQEETQPVSFLDARYELITRLKDSKALSGPYGYGDTFTSFGTGEDAEKAPLRLDYILYHSPVAVDVLQFGVLCNQYDDGLYISDHRPVIAKLAW
ncbi:hypothetical protein DFQ28_002568 [Apophysomyces sp. BC1034]|nr:hypothetical protein DFQ29_007188 [Apophysomyces sp. BC1021]KAG0193920.1 hypothetical protein DFQ28_002568 [Apophysomyces sp. BC1034]